MPAFQPILLEELLGTKMRALYQRKKGRDLFDFFVMFKHYPELDFQQIIDCFNFYIEKEGNNISKADFEQNMDKKLTDNIFLEDIIPLLRQDSSYAPQLAYTEFHRNLVCRLPGGLDSTA